MGTKASTTPVDGSLEIAEKAKYEHVKSRKNRSLVIKGKSTFSICRMAILLNTGRCCGTCQDYNEFSMYVSIYRSDALVISTHQPIVFSLSRWCLLLVSRLLALFLVCFVAKSSAPRTIPHTRHIHSFIGIKINENYFIYVWYCTVQSMTCTIPYPPF